MILPDWLSSFWLVIFRSLPARVWITACWLFKSAVWIEALPAALITPDVLFNVCATLIFNCPLASLWMSCPCWWLNSVAVRLIFCAAVVALSKLAVPKSIFKLLLLWILPCCPCRFCAVICNCCSPACKISPATELNVLVLISVVLALLIIFPALLSIRSATFRIKSFCPVCWIRPWSLFSCAVSILTCTALYWPAWLLIFCVAVKSSCCSAIILAFEVLSACVLTLMFLACVALWLRSAFFVALIAIDSPDKIVPAICACCASILRVAALLLSLPSESKPAAQIAFWLLLMLSDCTLILFSAANCPSCCSCFTVKSAVSPA